MNEIVGHIWLHKYMGGYVR